MAQTIETAAVTVQPTTGTSSAVYVVCTVRMPVSEYATFIATGTLTNSVPAAVTTKIAAIVTAGTIGG